MGGFNSTLDRIGSFRISPLLTERTEVRQTKENLSLNMRNGGNFHQRLANNLGILGCLLLINRVRYQTF